MFSASFQSIANGAAFYINSSCVDCISTDAINGIVSVLYKNGATYRYTNVSRRAIVKFNIDDARSMGKFVNTVLKQDGVNEKQIVFAN